ncbi:energy-coupling factor transporter transmembrane protein [Secundilactobacillus silagincola]|uniref:Energy-coupling factor transporter transmembrane protein n=1 Tax=Secundilactobacillus silagincola TaxID=1714681 RepID=A0A1Z5J0U9_9LACO|nr:energy-coupling factor transporter transmembrane component T [Secundilactobacillus silagincola]GAX07341.1 energy-coupling factor transporter transmembrane protein [Secundilactobacillus silagincola]
MINQTNIIKRLYPTTKVWLVIAITLCSVFFSGYLFQYGVFVIGLILAILGQVTGKYLSLFFKSIFLVALFIFIIQTLFVYHDHIILSWGIIHVSNTGLQMSYTMTSKIVAIGAILIWFFQVTEVKDIAAAMQNAGWNKKLTFVILSTMQLIPQMSALTATIADAQKSRGVETEGNLLTRIKSFVPMLGPVVLTSIEQNEERVLTLESRAFSSKVRPTLMLPIKKTGMDKILSWVIIIAFLISFYLGVFK